MVGWHHRLDGHEFEQALGVGEGQGGLACCSPWGNQELDMTEQLIKGNHNSEPQQHDIPPLLFFIFWQHQFGAPSASKLLIYKMPVLLVAERLASAPSINVGFNILCETILEKT